MDARSDLFGLGAVLYEMLTGEAPFRGDTQNDLIADILRSEPTPVTRRVPGIPKRLQAIVERALEKDSTQRYQSAESLLTDLQEFRRQADFQTRPQARIFWGALAALLIGLTGVSFLLVKQARRRVELAQPRSREHFG